MRDIHSWRGRGRVGVLPAIALAILCLKKKTTYFFMQLNSENINSVFNKSNVVSHYILVSVKLNVNLMQKIGEKTSLQRETTLLFTNYLPCMMNILPVSPAFSFSSNF